MSLRILGTVPHVCVTPAAARRVGSVSPVDLPPIAASGASGAGGRTSHIGLDQARESGLPASALAKSGRLDYQPVVIDTSLPSDRAFDQLPTPLRHADGTRRAAASGGRTLR